jgi:hypothetical protein
MLSKILSTTKKPDFFSNIECRKFSTLDVEKKRYFRCRSSFDNIFDKVEIHQIFPTDGKFGKLAIFGIGDFRQKYGKFSTKKPNNYRLFFKIL